MAPRGSAVIRIPSGNWYRLGASWIRQPGSWLEASQLLDEIDDTEVLTQTLVGRDCYGEPVYRTVVRVAPRTLVDLKALGPESLAYLIRQCDALNAQNVRQRDLQRRANRLL